MNINCFAHDPDMGCRILEDASGCGEGCPFRKTTAEAKAGQQAAYQQLARLPEEQQQMIADTYYLGMRPWRDAPRKAVGV